MTQQYAKIGWHRFLELTPSSQHYVPVSIRNVMECAPLRSIDPQHPKLQSCCRYPGMDGECNSWGGAIDSDDAFCRHCGAEQ